MGMVGDVSLDYACLQDGVSMSKQKFYGECRMDMPVLTAEGIYRRLLRLDLEEYEIAQLQRRWNVVGDHQTGNAVFRHDFLRQLQHGLCGAWVKGSSVFVKQQYAWFVHSSH